MSSVDVVALLRGAGLRVTSARVAALHVLDAHSHVDAETVARHVRAQLGSVSTQAVYDVLNALVEARLARRIEPAGSPVLYERRVGDNHHHLVCRGCRTVVDVDCAVGAAPCLDLPAGHGFTVDEAEVTWWGLCEACRTPAGAGAGTHAADA